MNSTCKTLIEENIRLNQMRLSKECLEQKEKGGLAYRSSFLYLVDESIKLKEMRLSKEYLEQMRKNDELLTLIEKDWKAFTIAFDEAKNNQLKKKKVNEKIEIPATKIDNVLIDFEKSFKPTINQKNNRSETKKQEKEIEFEYEFEF